MTLQGLSSTLAFRYSALTSIVSLIIIYKLDSFISEPLACNYTYNQGFSRIKSPFYPEYYPDNALCYYHFKTSPGKAFRINFNVFQLQKSPGCVNDSLKMYENGTLKTTLCGPYSRGLTSSDNNVLLVFKSDGSITDRGFYGYFNVIDIRTYPEVSHQKIMRLLY